MNASCWMWNSSIWTPRKTWYPNAVDLWTFDAYSYLIKDENRIKRAHNKFLKINVHFKPVKSSWIRDLEGFGHLMNASHVSLEHDYSRSWTWCFGTPAWEQGCSWSSAQEQDFGGCAIALVNKDKVEDFKKAVGQRYERSRWLCTKLLYCWSSWRFHSTWLMRKK